MSKIHIIGAGLAGSEAAWQALSRAATRDGVTVRVVIERLADEL